MKSKEQLCGDSQAGTKLRAVPKYGGLAQNHEKPQRGKEPRAAEARQTRHCKSKVAVTAQ